MKLERKDLLGLYDLSREEILCILDEADRMKALLKSGKKRVDDLRGRSVVTLFYENSTRTRVSFEYAAKFLSASNVNMSASSSSVAKGETLIDTGKTLDAMMTDVIVLRHPLSGAPRLLAKNVQAAVINAGDGINEHPTQALLDLMMMRERLTDLSGKRVAILGDIKHSRVAKSNLFALKKLDAEVVFFAPDTMIPAEIERLGAWRATTREEALTGADVVMGLRIQLERQKGGLFPSLAEYHACFGVGEKELALAKENALIMHPGPVNRGVELSSEVIDHPRSVIEEQVLSGVAVRMALLKLLTGRRE